MSDTPKSTSKSKSADTSTSTTSSKSETAKSSDSASSSSGGGESGKSSRESVGGAGAVHYGFFSNVKTPQYRSGWDDIWAKKPKSGKTKTSKKKPAKAKEPVVVNLSLNDLPDEVIKSLADAAQAQLKKSRINYANRDKAGAISWRIECEVKR